MFDLSRFQRIPLGHGPTPLEFLPRLSARLKRQIWIKRDDCTGLAAGGNKTRKLEFLLADALQQGADTLVTIGGLQSNHARQTAAAAAKHGLACELILQNVAGAPEQDYAQNGNVLLDRLLGAKIHHLGSADDADAFAQQHMQSLIQRGKRPYLIPLGGSNPLGSLGYVQCANEIIQQSAEQHLRFEHIVLASGSAGTQAGLLAGLIAAQTDIPVLGICVSRSGDEQQAKVEALLQQTLQLMGLNPQLADGKVQANGNYYGEGYGISTTAMVDAVNLCAQHEGLLLDPVYTGKAMAGLLDLCHTAYFKPSDNILFLHTGGNPGLYAYQSCF